MVFGSSKKSDRKTDEFTSFQYEGKSPVVEDKPVSFLAKTVKMEGKLFSEDDFIIEGQVKGTLEVKETLTIGRNGDVTADIQANIVKISGRVKGNIIASEKVVILAEGNFHGNIKSHKLVVAEGAILIGNINKEDETGAETKTIPIREVDQEPETGKSSEKTGPGAEEETEVIDAEIE